MNKIIVFCFLICFTFYGMAQNVSLDSSFGYAGIVQTPNATEIKKSVLTADGKIISVGYQLQTGGSGIYHTVIAKYNADGSLDTAFGTNGLVHPTIAYSDMAYRVLVQSDDKIIVSGQCYMGPTSSGPGGYASYLVRYDASGILDSTFGNNGIYLMSSNYSIYSMLLLPNNQLLLGGDKNGNAAISRFNTDGSFDTTFGTNGTVVYNQTSFKFGFSGFTLLRDNTILCYGSENTDTHNPKSTIAKLNSDGTFFSTFGNNGKIIVDTYVEPTSSFDIVYESCNKALERNDNKILVFGSSIPRYMMQLNADGTFDSSFGNNGILTHSYPNSDYALQNDGKIIIAGSKPLFDYDAGYTISRLNADGSFDSTFNYNTALDINISTGNDYLSCMNMQQDGKLVLSGSGKLNTISHFTLVRLTVLDNLTTTDFSEENLSILPNPFVDEINIESKLKITEIHIFDTHGRLVSKLNTENGISNHRLNLPNGVYFCTLASESGKVYHKKLIRN